MTLPLTPSRAVDAILSRIISFAATERTFSIRPDSSIWIDCQKRVQKKLPDLILLDFMMPEMDGLEVCRRLKAESATRQIPVIFLTASNEMNHLVQALDAGALDY